MGTCMLIVVLFRWKVSVHPYYLISVSFIFSVFQNDVFFFPCKSKAIITKNVLTVSEHVP